MGEVRMPKCFDAKISANRFHYQGPLNSSISKAGLATSAAMQMPRSLHPEPVSSQYRRPQPIGRCSVLREHRTSCERPTDSLALKFLPSLTVFAI